MTIADLLNVMPAPVQPNQHLGHHPESSHPVRLFNGRCQFGQAIPQVQESGQQGVLRPPGLALHLRSPAR
jgi:hypothetical protein